MSKLRLPAEWEPQSAVLLAWPDEHTDWNYVLEEARVCIGKIISEIIEDEKVILISRRSVEELEKYTTINNNLVVIDIPYNDTWARDFGPIVMQDGDSFRYLDFKFNGWGLKFASDKDNLISSNLYSKNIFNCEYVNHLNFVLEGGSIESDGKGLILSTKDCLLSPNRNGGMNFDEIQCYLKEVFNAHTVLWLSHGALSGDDTDGHIDTLARLAPGKTILYVKSNAAIDPIDGAELEMMEQELIGISEKLGMNLVALPTPDVMVDEDGMRIPATYANFLITNSKVLVPNYNQPENDSKANHIIQSCFPDRKVVGIDCSVLIKQHGSLHCVTMQLPKKCLK